MSHLFRLHAETEDPVMAFDADSAEGREGLRDAFGEYALDYTTWLPFAAQTYKISPNIEDYVITVTPICPADLPNRNGVGFPLNELTRFQPPPVARQVFKAWTGCPLHYEHDNADYTKAFGAVLDSNLSKVKGYGEGRLWKVMGLTAIDKVKNPDVAEAVAKRLIKTYSMGADAGGVSCSYCGQEAILKGYKDKTDRWGQPIFNTETGKPEKLPVYSHCNHLKNMNVEGGVDWYIEVDGLGKKHLVYRKAHNLFPFELSIVKDPAWTTAFSDQILQQ